MISNMFSKNPVAMGVMTLCFVVITVLYLLNHFLVAKRRRAEKRMEEDEHAHTDGDVSLCPFHSMWANEGNRPAAPNALGKHTAVVSDRTSEYDTTEAVDKTPHAADPRQLYPSVYVPPQRAVPSLPPKGTQQTY
jgi:uncharacterized membrane protein